MLRASSLVSVSRNAETCGECSGTCQKCLNKNSLHLHHEIEELKAKLAECNGRTIQMEVDFTAGQRSFETENAKTQDELLKLRDRYDRLIDSHKKLQRLNHTLECKLLSVVEKLEDEKRVLSDQVSNLNSHLLNSKLTVCDLQNDVDRYRQDCNVAVQLLQCKPTYFVQHKLSSFPPELQQRLKSQLPEKQQQLFDLDEYSQICLQGQQQQQQQAKIIRVPMATFPPTAIVYSVDRATTTTTTTQCGDSDDAVVPTTVIARVLTKPDRRDVQKSGRVVVCGRCLVDFVLVDRGTQTDVGIKRTTPHVNGSASSNGDSASLDCGRTAHPLPVQSQPKVHRPRHNSSEMTI